MDGEYMQGHLKVINPNIPTDIIEFVDFKVKVAKYKQEYLKINGLKDRNKKEYDRIYAMEHMQDKAYHHFFVMQEKKKVGCVELKIEPSHIDGEKVSVLKTIYVEEKYRSYSLFETLIKELEEMYSLRLEAEVWYQQPEFVYLNNLGFKNIYSRSYLLQ